MTSITTALSLNVWPHRVATRTTTATAPPTIAAGTQNKAALTFSQTSTEKSHWRLFLNMYHVDSLSKRLFSEEHEDTLLLMYLHHFVDTYVIHTNHRRNTHGTTVVVKKETGKKKKKKKNHITAHDAWHTFVLQPKYYFLDTVSQQYGCQHSSNNNNKNNNNDSHNDNSNNDKNELVCPRVQDIHQLPSRLVDAVLNASSSHAHDLLSSFSVTTNSTEHTTTLHDHRLSLELETLALRSIQLLASKENRTKKEPSSAEEDTVGMEVRPVQLANAKPEKRENINRSNISNSSNSRHSRGDTMEEEDDGPRAWKVCRFIETCLQDNAVHAMWVQQMKVHH